MQNRPLITRSQTQKVRMGGISEIADSRARPTTTTAMVPALAVAVLAKAALAFLGAGRARALTYLRTHAFTFPHEASLYILSLSLSLAKLHYAANITNDSTDTPLGEEAKLAAPQRGTRPAKWAGRHPVVWGGQQGTSNFPLNEAC